ncbi:hypothetical protein TRIP_B200204 [uncultured Desulfatiglans sp.]|uniref:Uncharacterized protein n=1 Tax=Uncultured Desulfatiglans sp. TaxID=1748965 RepID=A0A653A230_UNCDX|nr:hypothetical protein TRIP_B200204 [uncultured Desulfatiglans sp.]
MGIPVGFVRERARVYLQGIFSIDKLSKVATIPTLREQHLSF